MVERLGYACHACDVASLVKGVVLSLLFGIINPFSRKVNDTLHSLHHVIRLANWDV